MVVVCVNRLKWPISMFSTKAGSDVAFLWYSSSWRWGGRRMVICSVWTSTPGLIKHILKRVLQICIITSINWGTCKTQIKMRIRGGDIRKQWNLHLLRSDENLLEELHIHPAKREYLYGWIKNHITLQNSNPRPVLFGILWLFGIIIIHRCTLLTVALHFFP